jgi:hypothetical protein
MRITVIDNIGPEFSGFAKDFPDEFRGALLSAGQRWRNRLSQELRSGTPGGVALAPFSEVTLELRRRRSNVVISKYRNQLGNQRATRSKSARYGVITYRMARKQMTTGGVQKVLSDAGLTGFGGKLQRLVEFQIGDSTMAVGWLGVHFANADIAFENWEQGQVKGWTKAQKRFLHLALGEKRIPAGYDKPKRPAIPLSRDAFIQDVRETVAKNLTARLQRRIARATAP